MTLDIMDGRSAVCRGMMMDTFGFFVDFVLLLWLLVAGLATFLSFIAYLRSQQQALRRCAPRNRTMTPALVWLQIVPVFGFIWQFFVVRALSASLGGECLSRGAPRQMAPEARMGVEKAIVDAVALFLLIGSWAFPACLVSVYPDVSYSVFVSIWTVLFATSLFALQASLTLYVIYWIRVRKCARKMGLTAPWYPAS
jgi:hypothetical protein